LCIGEPHYFFFPLGLSTGSCVEVELKATENERDPVGMQNSMKEQCATVVSGQWEWSHPSSHNILEEVRDDFPQSRHYFSKKKKQGYWYWQI